jgi:hypothetical protein
MLSLFLIILYTWEDSVQPVVILHAVLVSNVLGQQQPDDKIFVLKNKLIELEITLRKKNKISTKSLNMLNIF